MNYNCNYILTKGNCLKEYHYNTDCFSSFYGNISNYSEITYYIPIESPHKGYITKFEESLILDYNELLKRLGLNFEYLGILESEFPDRNNFKSYGYKIVFSNNSIRGNKLLLNLLRYLYEGTYPEIVNNVFNLLKLDLNECLFNIFILAHYNDTQLGGHDIRGAYFYKLFENEESYFKLLDNNENLPILEQIPKFKGNIRFMELHKTFKRDLLQFYNEYKQLKDDEKHKTNLPF